MDFTKPEDRQKLITFADAWRDRMEEEMEGGMPLSSIHMPLAMKTAKDMKLLMQPFDLLCCMARLTITWKHGKELFDIYSAEQERQRSLAQPVNEGNSGEIKL